MDQLSEKVIGAAIRVHRELGPGLLESAYEICLAYELQNAGLMIEIQKPLPVVYRGVKLDCGYRMDIVVEGKLVLELKALEKILPIHEAQLLSYLRLSGISLGLIINFHSQLLKDGIKRLVHNF
ncbi:MAG: GxxExxY protein [Geobacteraceae bacterium GWC2_53_11]|nr:MAG: GxxExxY protein [Geobacteraceae bacterium GWC2_53_11]